MTQELLDRYPRWTPRPRPKRIPNGYETFNEVKHSFFVSSFSIAEPTSYIYPNYSVIPFIEEAFDQLDSGQSLRQVATWYNLNSPTKMTHAGIRHIRKSMRPDAIPKIVKAATKAKPRTMEERMRYRRSQKLTAEKKRLAATQKRIKKREEELSLFTTKKKKAEEASEQPFIEVPSDIEYDYTVIPEDEEVIFKPNPGPQEKFFAADEQEVLYGGAAGGGKSYALIADPLRYFGNKNFNGLILRRTNDELRELIWKSQELYPRAWPGARFSTKSSSWTFPSGAHLWFTYLERDEDVLRYQGQAFTYIGFDELTQHATPFAWDYMRSRLRTTDPTLPVYMRATTNPGGPGHSWVKRMFIDPSPANKAFTATDIDTGEPLVFPEGHAKAGQPLFKRKFIQARLSDNPYYADGQYEANLLSLPEAQRRRLLDGDWTVADGAAFSEFRMSLHVCEPFEIPRLWTKFRSCDFGYSERQASAVHWYAIEPSTGILYVYRELYINKKTGSQLAQMILDLERGESISYGVLDSSVWSVRGQTGPTIAEEMIRLGCRWRPSDRSAGSRISSKNRLHELLRVDPLTGKPGIIFFDTCRQIISDLPVIPMSKTDDDIDRRYPSDHAYDSIRYGIQSRPATVEDWGRSESRYEPSDRRFGY